MQRFKSLMKSVCWPQATMILLVIVLGLGSMLSGCGKKGPLYIQQEDSNSQHH
jgi:predicted small lipoprotein YifL